MKISTILRTLGTAFFIVLFVSCEKESPLIYLSKGCHSFEDLSNWVQVVDTGALNIYKASVNPTNPNQFVGVEVFMGTGMSEMVFWDLEGNIRISLTDQIPARMPQWNLNGQVVFSARDIGNPFDVYVFDANSYQITQLDSRFRSTTNPQWMTDGENLFLTHYFPSNNYNHAEVDLQGNIIDSFVGHIPIKRNSIGEYFYFLNFEGFNIYSSPNWNSKIDVVSPGQIAETSVLGGDWIGDDQIYYWNNFELSIINRQSGKFKTIYSGCHTRLIEAASYSPVDDHFYLNIRYINLLSLGKFSSTYKIYRIDSDGSDFEQYYP